MVVTPEMLTVRVRSNFGASHLPGSQIFNCTVFADQRDLRRKIIFHPISNTNPIFRLKVDGRNVFEKSKKKRAEIGICLSAKQGGRPGC